MASQTTIITARGANWKHVFLNNLAHCREFPTRLRLFNNMRKFWGMDLLKFTTPSGLPLLLDVTDYVQSQIYFYGNYETKSIRLFKSLAADAVIIFDIGAHIGQYALECAHDDIERSKQIFAIEVNPKTFTYLLNNIQLNKLVNVTPVLGAASSEPGILNINIPGYWNMGNTQANENTGIKDFDSYLAASFSISSLLEKYNLQYIDLIKIDVEGHEFDVLNSLFKKNIYPKNIIFEYIPDVFTQTVALVALLKEKGYIIKDMDNNNYMGQKELPEQNLWAQKI